MIQRTGKVLAVDLGENNLATTSEGKIFKGLQLRHERDKYVALRSRLLFNGSPSAMQRLRGISGKEALHVKHVNHVISKEIVETAAALGCDTIAMEDLTNIRKRIKAGKRVRFRLHSWPWAQLQAFIEYKARAKGINVVYVNPAYTSKTYADCGAIGSRSKHRFTCKICGIRRHSDLNASQNIRRIAMSAGVATGTVNYPQCVNRKI